MSDPYNLRRFVEAQAPLYEEVVAELAAGKKTGHWMWFIFPQIAGLGHSGAAQFYAISGLAEASAFLDHPLLGSRLRECAHLTLRSNALSAEALFGSIDALKFRSSMTLFSHATTDPAPFNAAIKRFYPAGQDPRTIELLGIPSPS